MTYSITSCILSWNGIENLQQSIALTQFMPFLDKKFGYDECRLWVSITDWSNTQACHTWESCLMVNCCQGEDL